ncbi:hypothetical protein B0H14DRAFT_3688703 [Mycena olivaceomarginata]|nr:hypothetical protein B0H14DRAFT_3688703 [Mycena olivaceomarginata]
MTTLDNKAPNISPGMVQNTVLPSVTEHGPGQSDPPRLIFNHVEFSGVSSTNCIQLSGGARANHPSHDIAPYQNSQIASNSRMSGKVGRPSPKSRETWGGRPHTLARGPLQLLARDSSPLFIQAADGRIKSACYAHTRRTFVSIHFRKTERGPSSIDSASLERWFFTGVSSQSTPQNRKGPVFRETRRPMNVGSLTAVSSQSTSRKNRKGTVFR